MKGLVASTLLLAAAPRGTSAENDGALTSDELQHHTSFESRIVGGTEAPPGEYPFFVKWAGCGASLIHEDIILSAAHCNTISRDDVLIGAYNTNNLNDEVEERTIVERREHPAYHDPSLRNDFLVMKLDEPSTITPIPLNTEYENPQAEDSLTVMGFGTTVDGGTFGSDILLEVTVDAISHTDCLSMYGGGIVDSVMFCAGVDGGGKDSCQGDSGGPIIDEDGTQVGVVSWGIGCGQPGHPGVYARVSGVDEWIREQICDLSENPPDYCPNANNGDNGEDSDEEGTDSADYSFGCDPNEDDGSGSVCVKFSFYLDGYPQETTAELVSLDGTGGDIQFYGFLEPGLQVESVRLQPGDYLLTIFDSFGDGTCCEYGDGRFEVHAAFSNQDVELANVDGSFSSSVQVEITVPEAQVFDTTAAATIRPTEGDEESPDESAGDEGDEESAEETSTGEDEDECQDLPGTFYADKVEEDVDCEWLAINIVRYNFLCQFLDVAALCRSTCDACEYFA